jgi:transposase
VCGFDGGKKVKGRKRHLLVDTLGLILAVVVTEANFPERLGGTVAVMEVEELAQGLNNPMGRCRLSSGKLCAGN